MLSTKHHLRSSKRVVSVTVTLFLVVTCCANVFLLSTNAEEQPPTHYSKDYTATNIFSDFQYFIKGDLNVTKHCVGAAAAGGTVTLDSFGDAAVTSSYFAKVASVGNYNSGAYLNSNYGGAYKAYLNHYPAYYKEKASASASTGGLTAYMGTTDYIDFNTAFTALTAESGTFASNGQTVSDSDISNNDVNGGKTLELNFSNTKDWNVVIPETIYDSISYINVKGISLSDLSTHQYLINVKGVQNIRFTFGYIDPASSLGADGTKGICFNGQTFNNDNSLKKMPGTIPSGELCSSGMKLIWNLPDATSVTTDYNEGHILAPSAAVTFKSGTGNFEGSIIAASLANADAEAHFFAYNAIPTTPVDNTPTSSSQASSSQASSSQASSSQASSSQASSSQAGSSAASAQTSAGGVVIDGTTGKVIQDIPTTITIESDSTKTVSIKSQDAVLFMQPDGTKSPLSDISKLDFSSNENSNVILTADGNIKFKNLKDATDETITVTYDLGNGQRIVIGTIDIKVSADGNVSVVSKLIDPYGTLTDAATGKTITGANITLYYADTSRNIASSKTPNTVVPLPAIPGFAPNNNANPQMSDANGDYAFMVFPNADYYIVVTKDGYQSYISPTISVEQNIIKFDIKMAGINPKTGSSNTDIKFFSIILCTSISCILFIILKIINRSKQN